MLNFFKKIGNKRTNVILNVSDMMLVRENVNKSLELVKEYFRTYRIFANKNNSLVKLIRLCDSRMSLSEDDYFYYFSEYTNDICKGLDFITPSNPRCVVKNNLFSNSVEIYLPVESYSYEFEEDILETKPIRLLFLEYDRLEYELYNANLDLSGGLAVFEINIANFAMMYRHAKLNNLITAPYHFINGYIYPGLMDQFVNLTILNRCRSLYYGNKQAMKQKYTRYAKTLSVDKRLDGVLKTYIKLMANKPMPIDMLLDNTPTINYSLSETLKFNYNFNLAQVAWIKFFITIPYARFYLDMMGDVGRTFNRDKLFDLMYDVKLLRTGTYNLWNNNAPEGCVERIKSDIEFITQHYLPDVVKK